MSDSIQSIRSQKGSVAIEFSIVVALIVLLTGMVDAANHTMYQMRLDSTTTSLASLAADLPAIDRPYDEQLKPHIDGLFAAGQKMFGKNSNHLGMRITWHQIVGNYEKSWKRGVRCDNFQKIVVPSRKLRTKMNRAHAEFVQVEMCVDLKNDMFFLPKFFNTGQVKSFSISVRRWWELL